MKFICSGSDLANAAGVVSKVLVAKSNIPILDGINILAKGSNVILSVYNQEIYIQKTIKADVYVEGEVVVDGKLFSDYTNKIGNKEEVEVEQKNENTLLMKFGNSDVEIPFFDKENFPQLGAYTGEYFFTIKEKELKELIDRAVFCISVNNNSRMILRSCNFTVSEEEVETVCLDGFRIAVSKKPVEAQNGKINFIIYGKHLQDLSKILGDTTDIIKVSKEGGMILFDIGHTKIKITTIDGEYFNYKNTLPAEIKNEIIVKKSDILDCLDRATIICRDTPYNKITLTFEEKMMNLYTVSEKGKVNENIECQNNGEEIKLAINCKFIQDAINRIKEDFFKIQIERPTKPIIVRQMEGDEYKCIILPLKLLG